jgi:glycosyltransferase involved in cell wall biosynthesis
MVQKRGKVIRVGFECFFDAGWQGGVNYFRNLLEAVYSMPERKIEVVIFTGTRSSERYFEGFPPQIKIVRNRIFDKGSIYWRMRFAFRRLLSRDVLFEKLLRTYQILILSHSDWLPGNSPIPTIGWIPDFQHVNLPEFFSADERATRDKYYKNICRYCSSVIVSSFDSQSDLGRFDSACVSKSHVLQFVVSLKGSKSALPRRTELEKHYDFSGNYFLLPNQFWKHKNHLVVIEAMGLLCKEGREVQVLATGNIEDYRHPAFFSSLKQRIEELGVGRYFRTLGLVSSADLSALMQYALAIINPSYFEGWSTTVEEAKAFGKRIILSDIPVHREQNPLLASYFQPDDPERLAAIMWSIWNSEALDNAEYCQNALCETDKRRLEFASKYQGIVLDTLGKAM